MVNDNLTFGGYLAQKREERDITLRELARQLGISAPFLSDVEKNRRAPLTADRLEKTASILQLSDEEKTQMYNLAGKQRNTVPPDLPEYIMERDYVSAALRTARDLDAGEEEWQRFIEDLKRRKG
ncbi:MAG: Helix-turn-helix domain protein [Pelotomaculum sp. PtaB.Bin104]|nr:MAG: Helix-turn-helix domain protein [Pelotomaculum sp. PtaB.Bin104]